jgi:hypothetical protein
MSLTYILIDFENVQPTAADMKLIRGADYRVRLFHGSHQNKFDAEMVKALQPLGVNLEYFQCERSGKNALDFHIAFCLGRLVQECEAAATQATTREKFFIVSKDGGFDTLLGHVRALRYGATRVGSVREALAFGEATDSAAATEPAAKTAPPPKKAAPSIAVTTPRKAPTAKAVLAKKVVKIATPPPKEAEKPDPWSRTIGNLRDHPNNRPSTVRKLENQITAFLGNGASEAAVKGLMERLHREGIAVANGNKIEYKISDGKK